MSAQENQPPKKLTTPPSPPPAPKPKKVTPEVLTSDLDAFTKYCGNEKQTGLCEAYVKTFNDHKRLSSEVSQLKVENASKSIRSLLWLGFIVFIIVILVMFIPDVLATLNEGLGSAFDGLFEGSP